MCNMSAGRLVAAQEGEWLCLDDGTGRNVYYYNKTTKKKTRTEPAGFQPELHINGTRKFLFRGTCIRCRKPSPAVCLFRNRGQFCFSLNYCEACILATTLDITRLRWNGDSIWSVHEDTPMHALFSVEERVTDPWRVEHLLQRSRDAYMGVYTSAKLRRNASRLALMRRRAQDAGIIDGAFLSWGFGEVFDEYFGEVDANSLPHGHGIKCYSDGSMYLGDWSHGMRHTTEKRAIWTRPDGLQYEGTWQNDQRHGSGEMRYPDQSFYRGEFAKGYEHGHGSKLFADGARFEGRFRFGKRDGPGTLTTAEGQVEKRIFRENDVFHEKPIPVVVEMIDEAAENVKLFQPESLLDMAIRALAKTMHDRQSLAPTTLVHNRLQDFLKPRVVKEFLETMQPMGTKDFLAVAPTFGFLSLPTVSVKHVKFKNYDTETFIYITAGNTSLRTLEVVNNRLDPSSLDLLVKRVASGTWPALQSLDLSFNRIDAMNARNLMNALKGVPHIKVLKMAGCGITAAGAQAIGEFLEHNNTLEELDLAFNSIQAAGVEPLARALAYNSSLWSLNLRQNSIGVTGGKVLVNAMKENRTIRVLCITDNKISGEVATEIAARLRGSARDVAVSFCAHELSLPIVHKEKT